jgi:hypothetical protein
MAEATCSLNAALYNSMRSRVHELDKPLLTPFAATYILYQIARGVCVLHAERCGILFVLFEIVELFFFFLCAETEP